MKRADWCAIRQAHGPHGANAKGGACEGSAEALSGPNSDRPHHTVNRKVVESSVKWLNGKLKEMGSPRRYEFEPGSSSKGQRHALLEYVPEQTHANREAIGRTYAEALKYVNAMNHALSGVVADRRIARLGILRGE